jgi:hypothetical protein
MDFSLTPDSFAWAKGDSVEVVGWEDNFAHRLVLVNGGS